MLTQQEYNDIIACIQMGSPIHANNLIAKINKLIELSDKYLSSLPKEDKEEPKGE